MGFGKFFKKVTHQVSKTVKKTVKQVNDVTVRVVSGNQVSGDDSIFIANKVGDVAKKAVDIHSIVGKALFRPDKAIVEAGKKVEEEAKKMTHSFGNEIGRWGDSFAGAIDDAGRDVASFSVKAVAKTTEFLGDMVGAVGSGVMNAIGSRNLLILGGAFVAYKIYDNESKKIDRRDNSQVNQNREY